MRISAPARFGEGEKHGDHVKVLPISMCITRRNQQQ